MTEVAGGLEGCGDCALSTGEGCCGAGHGSSVLRSDRSVLALGGVVVVLVTLGVLTVGTSRHVVVLVPAAVSVALGVAAALLGAMALRRPEPAGARSAAHGLALLPWAVAGLLVTVGAAAVRSLFG